MSLCLDPWSPDSPLVPVSKQPHPFVFPEFHSDLAPSPSCGEIYPLIASPDSFIRSPASHTNFEMRPLCLPIHTLPVLPPVAPAGKLSITLRRPRGSNALGRGSVSLPCLVSLEAVGHVPFL